MGLSLGGQSGSQNGSQSGTSSFNQSGTQNSTTGQTSSGTQTGTSTATNAGSTTVNPTDLWSQGSAALSKLLGTGGLTDTQNQALTRQAGVVQNQPMGFALQGVNNQLNSMIANPNIPSVAGGTANIYTGNQFMAPYESAYASDVLNPSLALFDQNTARQGAAMRNARDAGSAFGDRATLADSAFAQDQALARAGVAGNILGQGYQSALGAGQSDAAKALAASVANASNATTASAANAANALGARGQNLEAAGQMAANDINTNNIGLANNQALYGMGGGGLSNALAIMGSQVPAFGTSSTGLSAANTNSTFNNIMNSIFSGSNSSSGTGAYSGLSSGNSSSKGGGIG